MHVVYKHVWSVNVSIYKLTARMWGPTEKLCRERNYTNYACSLLACYCVCVCVSISLCTLVCVCMCKHALDLSGARVITCVSLCSHLLCMHASPGEISSFEWSRHSCCSQAQGQAQCLTNDRHLLHNTTLTLAAMWARRMTVRFTAN